MNKFLTFTLGVFFCLLPFLSTSQTLAEGHEKCVSDHIHQEKILKDEAYARRMEEIHAAYVEMAQRIAQGENPDGVRSATVYTIPVVVHIMHLPGTETGQDENISMSLIEQGISDLNDGFRNLGAYAGHGHNANIPSQDIEIEFCLATTDPSGNPTNGVNRVGTSYSNLIRDQAVSGACGGDQDGALKDLSRWDTNDYMNIWLVKEICTTDASTCSTTAYAYYPGAHGNCYDGLVIEADRFGASSSLSSTTIHEAGHYFNLRHTWGAGSDPDCTNNDCLSDNDFVCDTPPDGSTSSVTCGDASDTCSTDEDDTSINNPYRPTGMGGLGNQDDNYENYMDYGSRTCRNTFTQGQKDRMRLSLTGTRASLLSSTGCALASGNYAYFYDAGTGAAEASAVTASGCRSYYDVDADIHLYKSATSAVTVTLSVDAGSTAASGADFELLSSTTVSFAIGESSKTISFRVYDDAAVESTEVGIINIVSVTGGASAAPFNQSHRLSIKDNDIAPDGERPVIFSDNFEAGNSGWTKSRFGDPSVNYWEFGTNGCAGFGGSAYVSDDDGATNSYTGVASRPLIYRAIDATGYTDLEMTFDYAAGGDGTGDYGRYIRRLGTSGSFTTSATKYSGVTCGSTSSATVDLSAHGLDNALFTIGFEWFMDGSAVDDPSFTIDNVEITGGATTVETVVSSSASEYLGPNADVYFMSGDGEVIARIRNLSDHDYGCTTVTVSTAGTGAFAGGGGTSFENYDFMDKSISVTPTTNNPSGQYEITLYYTETELAGWESAAADIRASLTMIKSSGALNVADLPNSDEGPFSESTFSTGNAYGYTATFGTGFSTFGLVNAPPSAFPVELLAFDGEQVGEASLLHWATASEINSDYFVVERSADGIRYEGIGQVAAAGFSEEEEHYYFMDKAPLTGNNYYRLRQVDMDGTEEFFGPIVIVFSRKGLQGLYPVPLRHGQQLILEYDAAESGPLSIEVFDTAGRRVLASETEVRKDFNRLALDSGGIGEGIYLLRIQQADRVEAKRFVIVR